MGRVQTTNYSAEADTQFQWATAGTDPFSRLLDLYRLAIALEKHDHGGPSEGGNRGLAVRRIANDIITTNNLKDNAVTEAKIANGAVTNPKLGPNAVTYDRILWPLIQSANNMDGGIKLREISNTYAFGVYVATNGLVSLGAGNVPTPRTNLILGQNGEVSIGTVQGAARFNLVQVGNSIGSGLRAYNTNTGYYTDLYNEANGDGCLAYNGVPTLYINNGRISINGRNYSGRVNVVQGAATLNEGLAVVYGGGYLTVWVDANGDGVFQSGGTIVRVEHGAAALSPGSNGAYALGRNGLAWGPLWCGAANINGPLAVNGALSINGALTGVTTMSPAGNLIPTANVTYDIGSAALNWRDGYFNSVKVGTINIGGAIVPNNISLQDCGLQNNQWRYVWSSNLYASMSGTGTYAIQIGSGDAAKPGGGAWNVPSDSRSKVTESIRDYDGGLEKLLQLRPIYFKYNGLANTPAPEDHDEYIGLVAEEALAVAPELVTVRPTRLNPNDETEEPVEFHYLNPSAMPFMLINALKEITARLEALEAKLG